MRIKVKVWPKAGDNLFRNQSKRGNEGETTAPKFVKGCMTIMLRYLLAHPLPKPFNRLEIRAIGREGQNREA